MSTNIVTITMDDSLKTAKEIFDNTRFHHLLVVEADKLFGIMSDRDLLKALSPNAGTAYETEQDAATLNKKAHQVMSRKPVTLRKDASIQDAISIFNNQSISCIPIVDELNKPIGIISWRDILKTLQPN